MLRRLPGRESRDGRMGEGFVLMEGENVGEFISHPLRVGDAGAIAPGAFDLPVTVGVNEFHLAALPPPAMDLSRRGDPKRSLRAQQREVGQQFVVDRPGFLGSDIVGVNDEAGESVLLKDEFRLFPPKSGRMVAQDVEGAVVLRGG